MTTLSVYKRPFVNTFEVDKYPYANLVLVSEIREWPFIKWLPPQILPNVSLLTMMYPTIYLDALCHKFVLCTVLSLMNVLLQQLFTDLFVCGLGLGQHYSRAAICNSHLYERMFIYLCLYIGSL